MKNKLIIAVVAAVVVFGAGYGFVRYTAKHTNNSPEKETMSKGAMEEKENMKMEKTEDKMMPKDGEAMIKGDEAMREGKMMEQKFGVYKDFSPSALAEATKNGGKAVLFFWAAWCPYCKEANADFTANAGQIPAGVTVLKVDYDAEKDLKTKYGITYQHTFVQVDANGSLITKWSGGGVKELVSNIK